MATTASRAGSRIPAAQPQWSLRPSIWDMQLQLLIPTVAVAYVFITPYTKVEESFNIQALHDWLILGPSRIDEWDHVLFPGAVPRSFIPSFILAALSYPCLLALKILGLIRTSAHLQIALRCVLALSWSAALLFFSHRLAKYLDVSLWQVDDDAHGQIRLKRWIHRSLLLTSIVQFRLPFYASRTLPNSLAMPLVLVALALILPRGLQNQRSHLTGVIILTFAAAVYRLELAALLGACGLYLLHDHLTMDRGEFDPNILESVALLAGVAQMAITLSGLLSTGVDSWLWRSVKNGKGWIWPEIEALNFNVVQSRSKEWGVSPWHFYITSALPMLLLLTFPLTALGVFTVLYRTASAEHGTAGSSSTVPKAFRSVPPMAPLWLTVVHVGLLSLLGHKEWRFIMYVGPLLNILAGLGAALCITASSAQSRTATLVPRWLRRSIGPLIPVGFWSSSLILGLVPLALSCHNYPGGDALQYLHRRVRGPARVHVDVPAAMSGVTLFQSIHLPSHRGIGAGGGFGLSFLPSVLPTHKGEDEEPQWMYDKTENLPPLNGSSTSLPEEWQHYDFLVSGQTCPTPYFEHIIVPEAPLASIDDDDDNRADIEGDWGATGGITGKAAIFHEADGIWLEATKERLDKLRPNVTSSMFTAEAGLPDKPYAGYATRQSSAEGDTGRVPGHVVAEGAFLYLFTRSPGQRSDTRIWFVVGLKYKHRVWLCKRRGLNITEVA